MPRTQISTSVPKATREKADHLVANHYGSLTHLLCELIGREYDARYLHLSDRQHLEAGLCAPCAECRRSIRPDEGWQPGMYGEVFCPECQKPERQ